MIRYGIFETLEDALQESGRAGRKMDDAVLYIVMYESWLLDEKYAIDGASVAALQPGEPIEGVLNGSKNGQSTHKKFRISKEAIEFIHCQCIRAFFAEKLHDINHAGMWSRSIINPASYFYFSP